MKNSFVKFLKVLFVISLFILITGTLNITQQIFIKDNHSTIFCCCSGKVEDVCTCDGACCSSESIHLGQQLTSAACGQPLQLESINIDFKFVFDPLDYSAEYPTDLKFYIHVFSSYSSNSIYPNDKPPQILPIA
ncbi:MAG: hypothetical protein GXO85_14425 [Chlorobi bacterium]|nr:hypothetical protein [Chlorobiota bacterium]